MGQQTTGRSSTRRAQCEASMRSSSSTSCWTWMPRARQIILVTMEPTRRLTYPTCFGCGNETSCYVPYFHCLIYRDNARCITPRRPSLERLLAVRCRRGSRHVTCIPAFLRWEWPEFRLDGRSGRPCRPPGRRHITDMVQLSSSEELCLYLRSQSDLLTNQTPTLVCLQ